VSTSKPEAEQVTDRRTNGQHERGDLIGCSLGEVKDVRRNGSAVAIFSIARTE
jgi:hypothetical protein